ncbi:MAG: class II aldolase/adducin family protein [Elusimicrobia bacterium]|nr:class II aldolase/adducin family protein [Candidatus Obscuribacterium magneticum]
MNKQEGVIKFDLNFSKGPALPLEKVWELNNWRKILCLNGIIGQDPSRYEGFGFGNVSRRIEPWDTPPTKRPFIISGTQTQQLSDLGAEHYTTVLECDPTKNSVLAMGPLPPSSEAITHGTIYDLDPEIHFAFHVHSPRIWRKARVLGFPLTNETALYGTPEMAEEVKRLYEAGLIREKHIFAMGGHEDGVVSFGRSANEAGFLLLNYLVWAL